MNDLDAARREMIRANAAFAVEEFSKLREEGFGLDAASVSWVEGFIERQRVRLPEGEEPDGLVSVIGSYLGEAIIAAAGGRWVEDDNGGVGVTFDNGDTAYPFAKVAKQFEQGLEQGESIASFYKVSVDLVAKGGLHDQRARRSG
jgi:hypothetical protein